MYRRHQPGSTFVAVLTEEVEKRAIQRGAIAFVRKERRGLRPHSYTFPDGWLDQPIPPDEAA